MSGRGRVLVRVAARPKPAATDGRWRRAWLHPSAGGAGTANLADSPSILTFSTDTFIEDFLGALPTADGTWPATWTPLVPYRDWSEPPRETLDVTGAPRYPATIDRRAPLAGEVLGPDGDTRLPDARTDISFARADTRTPWLRKLYLPLHLHFHLVTAQLVCNQRGAPRIDPSRVTETGLVVRRLIASTRARADGVTGERWEDWIPSPLGGGLWVELSGVDGQMARTAGPLDPTALPADLAFANITAEEVLARLAPGDKPYTLGSVKMSRVPPTLGSGAVHSAYFGVLPVSSADTERPPVETALVDAARAKLKGAAVAAIDDAVTSAAGQAGLAAFATTWNLVVEVALAEAPTSADVLLAKALIPSVPYAVTAAPSRAVAGLLAAVDTGVAYTSATTLWSAVAANAALLQAPGSVRDAILAFPDAYATVLRDELQDALDASTIAPDDDLKLRGALLVLVRRARVALQLEIDEQIVGDAAKDHALDADPVTDFLHVTVATYAAGIDAARLGEDLRASPPVQTTPRPVTWPAPSWEPWAASALTVHYVELHEAMVAAERAIETVCRAVEGAGAGVTAVIDGWAADVISDLTAAFGEDPRRRGVDPTIATERAVLVWPTPDAAVAGALSAEVGAWYDSASNTTAITTEQGDRRRLVQSRFDHRSLYAVWTWARVKDTDPCAADQIVWSRRSEVYSLAETTDILGAKPVAFSLPDIPKLLKDVPRIPLAGANPFAALTLPSGSSVSTGEEMMDTAQKWGVAWICSFGIPVFTICAWILFSIIFSILLLIGFGWMLLLKFCIPVPVPKS